MIYHKIEQRSAAWFAARIGKPTASEFHKILTGGGKDSSKAKISDQAEGYAHALLAEMMLGKPLDAPETEWMIRGQVLEDSAIEAYEFESGLETSPGGFVTDDLGLVGCSPDRLVGECGLLEMKIPAPQTHIGYLLDRRSLELGKRPQVQGQLLVTERDWVDLVSYHPEMPLVIVRVVRDEVYIGLLQRALAAFVAQLAAMREKLEREFGKFPEVKATERIAEDYGTLGVTEDDVTAIWEASQR